MELQVSADDVSGTYTSKTSGETGGGPVRGPIKGYTKGDLISFLVLWPGGSMTAWTGQMIGSEEAEIIQTLWHLVTEVPDENEPDYLWQSTFAGSDRFERTSTDDV